MSLLQQALTLAKKGFHVFPLIPDSKLPLIKDFPTRATRDPEEIKKWWTDDVLEVELNYNVGISTSRFADDDHLIVVDVDNKEGKDGSGVLFQLELDGYEFPKTFCQHTPTGGLHLVYRSKEIVKQGAGVLGSGLDIRARGGYIVGAGSRVKSGAYTCVDAPLSDAPEWIIARCRRDNRQPGKAASVGELGAASISSAVKRGRFYLENEAPVAIEGEGGDQTTYRVACRLKDFGVSEADCSMLMTTYWNERCEPSWDIEELDKKIANAYRYGAESVGADAPELTFQKIEDPLKREHPFKEMNKEFAFVTAGGGAHILWETKDPRGRFKLEHLGVLAFHQMLGARTFTLGDGKTKPLSEMWMKSPERRSYQGICFRPQQDAPKDYYNLWRGFSVEPAAKGTPIHPSVQMFLDHALENVCHKNKDLFTWLIGYFAHLVQRPWEKPLVALVFRGRKGVGKNALVERVGNLLGNHFLLTSNRRYLVGNFNGHMENLLLFALDEAFWSGDKQAEGTLKDLITGAKHVVEHKGKEPYAVENCTRVVIIGNEDWLVPASQDERRFAVFNVGEGRKQDRAYFQSMREGMERGGYASLLRYLLDFDISELDINAAPSTEALMEQKVSSLDPFHQWWLDCLTEGKLCYSEFGSEWQVSIDKDRFRAAFKRYIKERNIRSRIPEDRTIGRLLHACLPGLDASGKRREGAELVNIYKIPSLLDCRKAWDNFIGHPNSWPET